MNEKNYVLVSHDDNRALYYAGVKKSDGSPSFSYNVLHAVRFTLSEIAELFAQSADIIWLGITIVRIETVTFEALKHEVFFQTIENNDFLRKKYSDFLRVAR